MCQALRPHPPIYSSDITAGTHFPLMSCAGLAGD